MKPTLLPKAMEKHSGDDQTKRLYQPILVTDKMEKTIPLIQLKTLVFFNVTTCFDLVRSSSG